MSTLAHTTASACRGTSTHTRAPAGTATVRDIYTSFHSNYQLHWSLLGKYSYCLDNEHIGTHHCECLPGDFHAHEGSCWHSYGERYLYFISLKLSASLVAA